MREQGFVKNLLFWYLIKSNQKVLGKKKTKRNTNGTEFDKRAWVLI